VLKIVAFQERALLINILNWKHIIVVSRVKPKGILLQLCWKCFYRERLHITLEECRDTKFYNVSAGCIPMSVP
jgi:hypothetical protein